MINQNKIVQVARQFIGTPFVFQGRLPNVGLDCAGLLAVVAKHNNLVFNDQFGYNVKDWTGDKLIAEVERNFETVVKLENACILLIWYRRSHLPQHFAIYTDRGTIIHTEEATGKVIEVQYDDKWKKHTHSIWRFKEV